MTFFEWMGLIFLMVMSFTVGIGFGARAAADRTKKKNQSIFHTMWVYDQVTQGNLTTSEGAALLDGELPASLKLGTHCLKKDYKN